MIIVTGASRGLGLAIASRLQTLGEEVLGISRTPKTDLPFRTFACDVSSPTGLKELATELRKKGEEVTGLINAAGIASMNLAVTTPSQIARQLVETNLLGTIYACQQFAPLMMRAKQGRIINFSTIAVSLGLEGESIYVASKAGVEGFTRAFAREVSAFNITANCIAPGPIDTDLIKGVGKEKIDKIVARQIIREKFSPDAVCDLVEVLLDPRSASLSGQVLNVGGA